MHHHSFDMPGVLDSQILQSYGIVLSMLLAGLVGSLTHCIGMCSPFVLAQVANRVDRAGAMSEWARLRAAALWPYHLGRMTTYTALGGVGGLTSSVLVQWTGFRWFGVALLATGAVLFLLAALNRSSGSSLLPSMRFMQAITRVLRPLSADPRGIKGYLLGVVLGFLPCGLIYAALAVAAGTGDPLLGALGMAAFAIGTAPLLIVTGFVGAALARRWREALGRLTKPLLIFNAAILLLIAVRSALA